MPAYSLEEYLNLPEPDTVWIWRGLLPVAGSGLLFSNPKVGKSMLALGLSESIADESAQSFLGQPIQTHGAVLYLQLDTPRTLWRTGYASKVKAEAKALTYVIDHQIEDLPKPFDIRRPECQLWLRREADRIKPVLVIIDTIRRMHNGDENDATVMQNVMDAFLWTLAPAAMLFLAHQRKPSAQGDTAGTSTLPRGSSALMGAVDSIIHMTKKRLRIEARSDVDEEIEIYQKGNGFFDINSRAEDVQAFLMSLDHTSKARERDKLIAQQFGVSERTARGWRVDFEKEFQSQGNS